MSGILQAWSSLPALLGMLVAMIAPTSHQQQRQDCFERPARCGYPAPGSTGVPAGTKLKPSGSITVTRDGTTLSGLDVDGTVTVAADGVTISGSRIAPGRGGSGSVAVTLEQGAEDFTIEDTEVAGPAHGDGLESAVWNHYNNPGATAIRVHFHHCADCWEGSGTFRDSYLVVNAAYPGSHDENVYVCGGTMKVRHSTLVNKHGQTAAVFGDTGGCGPNRIVVTDSLLAGGGYVIYPQANSDQTMGSMNISRNRFARCLSAPVFDSGSGGTYCAGNSDSHGVFPNGGYYGIAAYYYLGPGQVWRKNVWDDNGKPVCPTGSCKG